MGQALPKRRAVLIVEDDAELRSLTASLLKDEQLDTIECESAEAALAVMLMGAREVAMMFADVWLSGPMDGVDLAREVKMRWPSLPVILTSGRSRESVGKLPPGVTYMPKPWQPLDVLIATDGRERPRTSFAANVRCLEGVRFPTRAFLLTEPAGAGDNACQYP